MATAREINEIIDLQTGSLALFSGPIALNVKREDCPDVGLSISPACEDELHFSAHGCDIVLDSYCDGRVFLHIRKYEPKDE